jgi:uncharacterized protein
MKFLVLILVVLALVWWVRRQAGASSPRRQPPAPPQEPMLACAHCGLHIPRGEALPGRGGVFCGEAHRTAYEKAHPPS